MGAFLSVPLVLLAFVISYFVFRPKKKRDLPGG
ncbi:hypothetical protein Pan153_19590 [Gimesia panareensis]|uniref:Uncharacterized protein n=1 Tax=Gimesia panareensis TaxID=2527978 RepID=A0A518FLU7_9PLAN|nr:hypothetical protein Pan153_19590 [Gimesia panareensis]